MSEPEGATALAARLDELLNEHRATLLNSLDGSTEEEARRRLVPSRTTLLGLVRDLHLEDEVTGRGRRALWAIYAHMLRELAQHCGHADILREQVLASREGGAAVLDAVVGVNHGARPKERP